MLADKFSRQTRISAQMEGKAQRSRKKADKAARKVDIN